MNKKTIVIFTGGNYPPVESLYKIILKDEINYIIAADSGFTTAIDNDIIPNLAVGDFDSVDVISLLSGVSKRKTFFIKYPHDKDYTDTQLALMWAKRISKKARVILFGGSGGRLDHLFSLYNTFEREYHPDIWLTESQAVYYINKHDKVFLHDKTNSAIGVIRLPGVIGHGKIKTRGLQWNGERFFNGVIATSCNRIADNNKNHTAVFNVKSGKYLLCVGYTARVTIH